MDNKKSSLDNKQNSSNSYNRKLIYKKSNYIYFLRITNDNDIEIVKNYIVKEMEKNEKIISLTDQKSYNFLFDCNSNSLNKIISYLLSNVFKMNTDFTGPIFFDITEPIEKHELESKNFTEFLDFVDLLSSEPKVFLYAKQTDMDDSNVLEKLNKRINVKLYDSISIFAKHILIELKNTFKENKIEYQFDWDKVSKSLAKNYIESKDYSNLDRFIGNVVKMVKPINDKIKNESFCPVLGQAWLKNGGKNDYETRSI